MSLLSLLMMLANLVLRSSSDMCQCSTTVSHEVRLLIALISN